VFISINTALNISIQEIVAGLPNRRFHTDLRTFHKPNQVGDIWILHHSMNLKRSPPPKKKRENYQLIKNSVLKKQQQKHSICEELKNIAGDQNVRLLMYKDTVMTFQQH